MKKWEYKYFWFTDQMNSEFDMLRVDFCNDLGQKGWEIIEENHNDDNSCLKGTNAISIYFAKRELK